MDRRPPTGIWLETGLGAKVPQGDLSRRGAQGRSLPPALAAPPRLRRPTPALQEGTGPPDTPFQVRRRGGGQKAGSSGGQSQPSLPTRCISQAGGRKAHPAEAQGRVLSTGGGSRAQCKPPRGVKVPSPGSGFRSREGAQPEPSPLRSTGAHAWRGSGCGLPAGSAPGLGVPAVSPQKCREGVEGPRPGWGAAGAMISGTCGSQGAGHRVGVVSGSF